jgi:heat shock protein HslJ
MIKSTPLAWALAALLAAGSATALEEKPAARGSDARDWTAPGWVERSINRIERAIARLEARLSGRSSGMGGCEDMMGGGMMDGGGMMGGGMMGGSRPNERWRGSGR